MLPLAHNGFLVGLLVVERCLEEEDALASVSSSAAAGSAVEAAAAAGASSSGSGGNGATGPSAATATAPGGGGASSNGGAAAMPQPPACLLFRSAEVQLLKQTAAVLALACAMDMRAALERVGAAVRQRQASALVQEVSWGGCMGTCGMRWVCEQCGSLHEWQAALLRAKARCWGCPCTSCPCTS